MARKNDYGISTILYAILILFYIPISILIFIFKIIVIVLVKIFSFNNASGKEIFLGEDEKSALEKIDTCEGHEFEYIVADLLKYNNFKNIEVTKGSGDYGADIIATLNDEKYAIQCKRYDGKVGSAPIGEVLRAMNKYNCAKGIVITNNFYTKQAIEEGKINKVLLWDRDNLIKLIKNEFKDTTKNKKREKIKRIINSPEVVVAFSVIIALCIVVGIVAGISNSIHKELVRQETEVGYQLDEYGNYLKEKVDETLRDTKYSLYHMNGSVYSENYILIEIISKDNKFSEEDVKDISKKLYEECEQIHFKKAGLLNEDSIQISLCFETTNTYPTTMTISGTAYTVRFDTKQAENKVDFENAITIEKGT